MRSSLGFKLFDGSEHHFATLKVYEKVLDIISRNGRYLVGSKLPKLLNSNKNDSGVVKRIVQAMNEGVTRLELSLNFDLSPGTSAWRTFRCFAFYDKVARFFKYLSDNFLNNTEIRERVHHSLNVSMLLKEIAHVKTNALVIGRYESWLILASTACPGHAIGTSRTARIRGTFRHKKSMESIKNLILRFACPGATIKVWYLFRHGDFTKPIFELEKKSRSAFQYPWTTKVDTSFNLPAHMKHVYRNEELNDAWLPEWEKLVARIQEVLTEVEDEARARLVKEPEEKDYYYESDVEMHADEWMDAFEERKHYMLQ